MKYISKNETIVLQLGRQMTQLPWENHRYNSSKKLFKLFNCIP
jgi:hypothetical protein